MNTTMMLRLRREFFFNGASSRRRNDRRRINHRAGRSIFVVISFSFPSFFFRFRSRQRDRVGSFFVFRCDWNVMNRAINGATIGRAVGSRWPTEAELLSFWASELVKQSPWNIDGETNQLVFVCVCVLCVRKLGKFRSILDLCVSYRIESKANTHTHANANESDWISARTWRLFGFFFTFLFETETKDDKETHRKRERERVYLWI